MMINSRKYTISNLLENYSAVNQVHPGVDFCKYFVNIYGSSCWVGPHQVRLVNACFQNAKKRKTREVKFARADQARPSVCIFVCWCQDWELFTWLPLNIIQSQAWLRCPSKHNLPDWPGLGWAGSEWFVTQMLTHINKLTICWSLYNTAFYSQEILHSNVVTIDFCLNPKIFKEEKNISKVNNSEAREQTKRANRTQKKLKPKLCK